MPGEFGHVRLGGLAGAGFQMAVQGDHFIGQRRELRSPSVRAALAGFDERMNEAAVHRVDQMPGAFVAHPHGTAGRGDGAGFADGFEQLDFAGSERDVVAEEEAEGEAGRHGAMIAGRMPGRRAKLSRFTVSMKSAT